MPHYNMLLLLAIILREIYFFGVIFYQSGYENIIYNFYKEKYPWYPWPSLISKPNIGLIIKQKIAPLNI